MNYGIKNQNIDEIIGNKIKIFRRIYGVKRNELAEKFHISDDAVYRIERGETGFSSEYAYILANEYGCDMNFIYGSEEISEFILKSIGSSIDEAKKNGCNDDIMGAAARMLRMAAEILEQNSKKQD